MENWRNDIDRQKLTYSDKSPDSGHQKTLTEWPGVVPGPLLSHGIAQLYNTIFKVMFNISNIFHVFRNATRKALRELGTSRCQEDCKNCTYPCNENQLHTLFILSLFRQSTYTCFGHICSRPAGWPTDSQLKSTIRTNFCIYTVYLLMMGYKYARNM